MNRNRIYGAPLILISVDLLAYVFCFFPETTETDSANTIILEDRTISMLMLLLTFIIIVISIIIFYRITKIRIQIGNLKKSLENKNQTPFKEDLLEKFENIIGKKIKLLEAKLLENKKNEPPKYSESEIERLLSIDTIVKKIDLDYLKNLPKGTITKILNTEIQSIKATEDLHDLSKADFDKKINDFINGPLKDELNRASELNKEKEKETTSECTHYSPPPSPEGYFLKEKIKAIHNPNRHLYQIEINPQKPTEATFLFLNDEPEAIRSALTNYSYQLEPVCEIENGKVEGTHIIQDDNKPGKLRLEGDKWVVLKKLAVRIE